MNKKGEVVEQPVKKSKKDQNENEEIIQLKEEISGHLKELELMQQKKKNIHLVVDQV